MPLADLLTLIDVGRTGRLLGTLSISECRAGSADADAIEPADKASLRAVLDARILETLGAAGEALSPTEISDLLGGNPQDTRIALQRLAAAKKVRRTWKGRAHGYLLS